MTQQLAHPSPADLNAFSLGQLPPDDAAAVETHISDCDACCETLLQLSDDDTFIELLQESGRARGDATVDLVDTAISPASSASTDVPPELVEHPRYQIVGLIGRGGMGDVYRAEHRLMHRTVALKVINRELVSKPEAVERFRREVRAAAQLHHPNIVTAFDAEQAGETHFLAMEFVAGTELSEIVRHDGPLTSDVACDYARQVAEGLAHAHAMGMVHRDIKPQNLMRDESGRIKILDFGLASFASETAAETDEAMTSGDDNAPVTRPLTQLGTMMGTPDYIAPEQATDARNADIRSDIYSLGCTLYFLLTGRPPFEGDSVMEKVRSHSEHDAESLVAVRGDLPVELDSIVQRMMAKDPTIRYQDPQEVVDALAAFVDARIDARSALPSDGLPPDGIESIDPDEGGLPKLDRLAVAVATLTMCCAAIASLSGLSFPEVGVGWLVGTGIALGATSAIHSRQSPWKQTLVGWLAWGVTAFGGVLLYVATDTGNLEFNCEADIPGAKVILTKDGKQYATFDLAPGREAQSIRAGDYVVEVVGATDNANVDVWTKRGRTNDWGTPEFHEVEPVLVYRGGAMRIEVSKLKPATSSGSLIAASFGADDVTISQDNIAVDDGAWKITATEARIVRLFELTNPEIGAGRIAYRARLKSKDLRGRAYLEMWVRLPGKGEFFSKGFHNAISGDNDWAEYEIPFLLEKGQQPDLVKLNLAIEGAGTVWIKDIEIRKSAGNGAIDPKDGSLLGSLFGNRGTTADDRGVVANRKAEQLAAIAAINEMGGRMRFDTDDPALVTVTLNGERFNDSHLVHVGKLENIKSLYLPNTSVTDAGLEQHVRPMATLVNLYLTGSQVTDAGLQHLVGLDKLRVLYVNDLPITDDGLADVAKITGLAGLSLDYTQVTDAGLQDHISKMPNVKMLFLRNTQITDEGLASLESMEELAHLDLKDTAVTDEGVARFQEALPHCKVVR